MAHTIVFNPAAGIIETTLDGPVTFAEIKGVIAESTALAKTHGCRLWLTDYSSAAPALSLLEIYDLPPLFAEAALALAVHPHQIRRAIVVSRDNADYLFAKTIALNRGQSLELFHDVEAARHWLVSAAA